MPGYESAFVIAGRGVTNPGRFESGFPFTVGTLASLGDRGLWSVACSKSTCMRPPRPTDEAGLSILGDPGTGGAAMAEDIADAGLETWINEPCRVASRRIGGTSWPKIGRIVPVRKR